MKKVYVAPQTEAVELMASTVLMASPGATTTFDFMYGSGNGGGMR
jgi:hypothetical protein